MGLITSLWQGDKDEWEAYLSRRKEVTPFHTPAWMETTEEAFGFKGSYLVSKDASGTINGILPIFLVKNITFGGKLVSLPLRDKGNAIYDSPEIYEELIRGCIGLARSLKVSYVEIKTDREEDIEILKRSSFIEKDSWPVSYIRLYPDFNQTKRYFTDKRLNWSINKAVRSGLVFEEAATIGDMDDFYRIFLENRHRLGVPPYSRRFFYCIYNRFIDTGSAQLFFVSREGLRLTAIIVFMIRDRAYDVYSASIPEASQYRANDFQMYHVIKWLCEHGYTEYDLGADSSFQTSLLDYKGKWGAQTRRLYYYYYFNRQKDITIRDSDHPRYRYIRSVLKSLPLPIFERLGAYFIKKLA